MHLQNQELEEAKIFRGLSPKYGLNLCQAVAENNKEALIYFIRYHSMCI